MYHANLSYSNTSISLFGLFLTRFFSLKEWKWEKRTPSYLLNGYKIKCWYPTHLGCMWFCHSLLVLQIIKNSYSTIIHIYTNKISKLTFFNSFFGFLDWLNTWFLSRTKELCFINRTIETLNFFKLMSQNGTCQRLTFVLVLSNMVIVYDTPFYSTTRTNI